MKATLVVGLLFVLAVQCVHAADNKTPLFVVAQTEGTIGERLLFSIKEQIRRSESMRLALTATDAVYQIHINTLDIDGQEATVYSVVWALNTGKIQLPGLVSKTVGYCGTKHLDDCANGIVARTEKMISDDSAAFAAAWESTQHIKPAAPQPKQ